MGIKKLRIDGVIGDMFNTSEDIRLQIESLELKEDDVLEVTANSGGGSVFEGYGIYCLLKNLPNRVIMRGEGLIGSIMTLIFLAAEPDDTYINEVSMFMIHRALVGQGGNSEELEKQAEILKTIDATLIKVYAERTGISPDEIEQMMSKETWLSGADAVEMGFVKTLENPISAQAVADALSNLNTKQMSLKSLFGNFRNETEEDEKKKEEEAKAMSEEEKEEELKAEEDEKEEEDLKAETEEEEEEKVTMAMFNDLVNGISKVAAAVDSLMENQASQASIEAKVESKFTNLVEGLKKTNGVPKAGADIKDSYVDPYAKHRAAMKEIENKTSVTSGYNGDVADVLISLTKLGNQAVEKGSVYVQAGVQDKLTMPRFNAAANQLQARQEDPSIPSDSFTYDERTLEPLDAMFFDTVNPRNFEEVWRPFQPVGPLVDRIDNPQMQAAIMEETMKTIGTQLGALIWQGDTALTTADPLGFFDGYIKILAADGAIAPTPAGVITEGNVLSILAATVAAIPDAVYEDPNMVIHMSTADARLYEAASRALDFKGAAIGERGEMRYAGFEIRSYSGMAKDYIVIAKATAGKDSNLWAGVDVLGDESNVKIARYRPESEKFIVKALLKYAVQVGNPTECVLYSPA
jgi:ATP-dependent protease ClpP protease subunit